MNDVLSPRARQFLESRVWTSDKARNTARATLVEYEKFLTPVSVAVTLDNKKPVTEDGFSLSTNDAIKFAARQLALDFPESGRLDQPVPDRLPVRPLLSRRPH